MVNLVCSWVNCGPQRFVCGVREPVLGCQVSGEGMCYHGDLNSMMFLHDLEIFLGILEEAAEVGGAQGY